MPEAQPSIEVKPINVVMLNVADLVFDDDNARVHPEDNSAATQASLQEFGQLEPIVVQKSTMMVISGNDRLRLLKEGGAEQVNVFLLDVDDDKARRLSIIFNRTGELGEWNEKTLARQLAAIAEADLDFSPDAMGFSDEEFLALQALADGVDEAALKQVEKQADLKGRPGSVAQKGESGLPSSQTRMMQLFYNTTTMPEMKVWLKALAQQYGTTNETDTVYAVVKAAHEAMQAEK